MENKKKSRRQKGLGNSSERTDLMEILTWKCSGYSCGKRTNITIISKKHATLVTSPDFSAEENLHCPLKIRDILQKP